MALSETRAEALEQREKENRRNNVDLYNIPESIGARAEDRKKEDAALCLQLFSSLQVGVSEEDLIQPSDWANVLSQMTRPFYARDL